MSLSKSSGMGRSIVSKAVSFAKELVYNQDIDGLCGPINSGEVLRQNDDLHGVTVNAAARIAARAKGGEILIADVVRQLMAATPDLPLRTRAPVQLKGFTERWRLHEVLWQEMAAPAGTRNRAKWSAQNR